jgi:hypothetical protein
LPLWIGRVGSQLNTVSAHFVTGSKNDDPLSPAESLMIRKAEKDLVRYERRREVKKTMLS